MRNQSSGISLPLHHLSRADFDDLAHGAADARLTLKLRRAERSRRLLLLRALVDRAGKTPGLVSPLPPAEEAWELLAWVQEKDPAVVEVMLAHPYTGTWAGYTMRLLSTHISGVAPLWAHVGHLHAVAAAAAIRAGLDFHTSVPAWRGGVMLPSLGLAQLDTDSLWTVAEVTARRGRLKIESDSSWVSIPDVYAEESAHWAGLRYLSARANGHNLTVRLDDLDPYRGLYEPVPPLRLSQAEVADWRTIFSTAWQLIVRHLPMTAITFQVGLDSLVPGNQRAPFRIASGSTGEAFGSAIVTWPPDAMSLAASLVHEFQHILLGGLLHLSPLHDDDTKERCYAPWRDDPRPIGGLLQGIYAFAGVSRFWRAVARDSSGTPARRAAYEFAYWRTATWTTLGVARDDPCLTELGRQFLAGVTDWLGPWQAEPVPDDLGALAARISADHYAGWRLRHIRPDPAVVEQLTAAWLADPARPGRVMLGAERPPIPVPDGSWSPARAELARLSLTEPAAGPGSQSWWARVPDATEADAALISGRLADAARGYRAELADDPDRVGAWAGLGVTLHGIASTPAAKALLRTPELVRAVHRRVRAVGAGSPQPDRLAAWIGRSVR